MNDIELAKKKAHAQRLAASSIKRFSVARGPCRGCETSKQPIHAHHPDYDFPFRIVWLCAACHSKAHGPSGDAHYETTTLPDCRVKPPSRVRFRRVLPTGPFGGDARMVAEQYMKLNGISRAELAERIGVSAPQLSRWFGNTTRSVTERVLLESAELTPVESEA